MRAKQLYRQLITAIIIATLALYAVLIAGCSPAYKAAKCHKWGVCKTVKDSTYIKVKDSTYYVAIPYDVSQDSAYVVAYMECNQQNEVIIRESEITNGKYIQLLKDIKNGKYTVVARIAGRTDTVYVPTTSHSEVTSSTQVQPVKVNELTKWQSFRLGAFPWFVALLVLIIMYIGWKIYKRF